MLAAGGSNGSGQMVAKQSKFNDVHLLHLLRTVHFHGIMPAHSSFHKKSHSERYVFQASHPLSKALHELYVQNSFHDNAPHLKVV